MSKRMCIAIGIHIAIMLSIFIGPVWVMATGDTVYLETEKMDPRSLFRGHFVILGYKEAQDRLPEVPYNQRPKPGEANNTVYVTFTTDRPAKFVDVSYDKPDVGPGEVCIVGRPRGWGGSIDFPQIAQYFANKKLALELEDQRGENLLAKVRTSGGCNAVLLGLEAR